MIYRIAVLTVLAILGAAMLVACPESGGDAENPEVSSMPSAEGAPSTDAPPELPDSPEPESGEPEPILWKIAGVAEGEPVKFAAGTEGKFTLKFEFAEGCHYNEETPLELRVSAPEGIAVTPAELAYAKPDEVPEIFEFKVDGVETGSAGEIELDVVAFFCSDEGYCMRKMDTIKLGFAEGEPAEAPYAITYPLDPDL